MKTVKPLRLAPLGDEIIKLAKITPKGFCYSMERISPLNATKTVFLRFPQKRETP